MDRLTKRLNTTHAQRKESGFTLIELLIVIVILGILAGIAIFAVGTFQDDADAACANANERITKTQAAAAIASGKSASLYAEGACPP